MFPQFLSSNTSNSNTRRLIIPLWAPLILLFISAFIYFQHNVPSFAASDPADGASSDQQSGSGQAMAKQLMAADLLARNVTTDITHVPKIFHQSWFSLELPTKAQKWATTCREMHPDWEWVLWTDEDNLALVRKHFPWLEASYKAMQGEIYRADLARSMYMYIYGGVYADIDTECLLPSETLFEKHFPAQAESSHLIQYQKAFFGRMGIEPGFVNSIPNAWMGATPGHPFFFVYMNQVHQRVQAAGANDFSAEELTGPIALRAAIVHYEQEKVQHGNTISVEVGKLIKDHVFAGIESDGHQIILLPSHVIYPYSWWTDGVPVRPICSVQSDTWDPEQCKEKLHVKRNQSISITYWSHTHTRTGKDEVSLAHIQS